MALVNCPECGKEVSTYAEACPNCGCPKDVILKSIEKRKGTKECTKEERAKRKAYLDGSAELEEASKQAITDINNTLKCLEKIKEDERKNKRKSWTFMNNGSLWFKY